jgi:hypothetical protein
MNDRLKMSNPATLTASHNAISSRASVGGAMRFALQDGPMIAMFGPDRAHANLSARQAKVAGLLMSGIYGPRGSISLSSVALQSSLANRLRVRLASLGSTLFRLTWKTRTTPSGRPICALRASAHRTSDSDSTSWPSPVLNDSKGSDYTYNQGRHDSISLKLGGAAKLCSWPTDQARDGQHGSSISRTGGRRRNLDDYAKLATHTHTHTHTHTLAHDDCARLSNDIGRQGSARQDWGPVTSSNLLNAWANAEWLACSDGKYRAVEPGTFPLAYGVPGRVGLLRGYGNAIVPQVAAEFIAAYREITCVTSN